MWFLKIQISINIIYRREELKGILFWVLSKNPAFDGAKRIWFIYEVNYNI